MKKIIDFYDLSIKTIDEIIMMGIKDIMKDGKYQADTIRIFEKNIECNSKIQVRFDTTCDACDASHTNGTEGELTSVLIDKYFGQTREGKELDASEQASRKIEEIGDCNE